MSRLLSEVLPKEQKQHQGYQQKVAGEQQGLLSHVHEAVQAQMRTHNPDDQNACRDPIRLRMGIN
jgi:hypothetical protein